MVKMLRIAGASLFVILLVAACSGSGKSISGSSHNSSSFTGGTVAVNNGTVGYAGHPPGSEDVSTTQQGVGFNATPNFYYFPSCGRPCWLPLYPAPRIVLAASVTDNYPYERYAGNPGDTVQVVCQVHGDSLHNEAGVYSDIWDKVVLLKDKAVKNLDQLMAYNSDYLAYGADIWLGNTGWHGIPCR